MKALGEPFPPDFVHWRSLDFKDYKGKTPAAAYIDVRAIQDRLDEVFGPDRWQTEFRDVPSGQVECKLSVMFPGQDRWIQRVDVGSRSNQQDADDAVKACYSDAMKRAAVQLGIGRYLYRIGRVMAAWDAQRKVLTEVPALPNWALPEAFRDAGPRMADDALRKVADLCRAMKIEQGKYVAEYLTRCNLDPQSALATCSRRVVRGLLRKVEKDAESMPLPDRYPRTGGELAARLAAHDASMSAAGRCKVGELVAHVIRKGVQAGFPSALDDWKGLQIIRAGDFTLEFDKEHPEPKKKEKPAAGPQPAAAV